MMKLLKLIFVHALRVRFNVGSIWNFIYLNFISTHVKGDYKKGNILIPYPNCVFDLRKDSLIELNAPFIIGMPSIKKSKKASYLFMNEGASFLVHKESSIVDGCDIQIHRNAIFEIDLFHSNTGLEVSCGNHVKLEGEVTCGRHVRIKDYNGHYVSYHKYPISSPIYIKNHTWLCTGCTVGPGVTINEGAVVADNTNVVEDVPAKTFCSGNPAVVLENNIEFKI